MYFLTLGYTETWWDLDTGIIANEAPPYWLVKKYPERFEFRVIDEGECFECLEKIYLLLTSKLKTFNLINTVSPVPLGVTFTDQDVIVANMHSKATLRGAVGRFVKDHSKADYYQVSNSPCFPTQILFGGRTEYTSDQKLWIL